MFTEVTKQDRADLRSGPDEGVYVYGKPQRPSHPVFPGRANSDVRTHHRGVCGQACG